MNHMWEASGATVRDHGGGRARKATESECHATHQRHRSSHEGRVQSSAFDPSNHCRPSVNRLSAHGGDTRHSTLTLRTRAVCCPPRPAGRFKACVRVRSYFESAEARSRGKKCRPLELVLEPRAQNARFDRARPRAASSRSEVALALQLQVWLDRPTSRPPVRRSVSKRPGRGVTRAAPAAERSAPCRRRRWSARTENLRGLGSGRGLAKGLGYDQLAAERGPSQARVRTSQTTTIYTDAAVTEASPLPTL